MSMNHVLGRVPSGVYILTVRHDGQETGMLASWVMQAGFDPPMVTVAVKQGRYVAEWITAGVPFVLNMLAEGQKPLISHFARGFEPDEDAFTGLDISRNGQGVAILSESLGHLECRPHGHQDSGDHRIFLAEVVGGNQIHDGGPMVHIRKSGAHY